MGVLWFVVCSLCGFPLGTSSLREGGTFPGFPILSGDILSSHPQKNAFLILSPHWVTSTSRYSWRHMSVVKGIYWIRVVDIIERVENSAIPVYSFEIGLVSTREMRVRVDEDRDGSCKG